MDDTRLMRHNTLLMLLEGAVFWMALSFLQGDTVVSTFLDTTTGSIAIAGLAATLRSVLFMAGQFVTGMVIHRIKVQRKYMRTFGLVGRPLILLMAGLLGLGVTGPAAGYLFLVLYSLFFFLDGMVSLCWMEINTRTLPPKRRGVVSSTAQMVSGIVGIFVGIALQFILGNDMPFGQKYAIIFGLSGAIFMINLLLLVQIKDIDHPSYPEKPVLSLDKYVGSLIPLFTQNKPVRTLLYARMLYILTMISAPINVLFGRHMGGLDDAMVNALVFMPVLGQILAGIFWSQASRFLTYPIMMWMAEWIGVMSAVLNFVCYFMAAAGLPIMLPLSIAMALVSMNASGYIGFTQHMITLVDEGARSQYFVLSSLVTAPFTLGPYFAGVIVEHFGYLPVYIIMFAAGIAGMWLVKVSFLKNQSLFSAVRNRQ